MLRRIASWRRRAAAEPVAVPPVVVPPVVVPVVEIAPPDGDKVALVGEALRSTYEQQGDDLDDRLVALMLELSVEQPKTKPPRRRR